MSRVSRVARSAPAAPLAAAVWSLNWLALRATGHPYDLRVLYAGWQFLPVDAAAAGPISGVWHLHTQPPGWNLLVAAIQAWSPLPVSFTHQLVSLGLGAVLAAAIAATLTALGMSRGWALAITVVATANSQVMSNAFEPRYDLAVTALVAVLVWAVVARRGVLLAVCVATALVMTRSLFHPVWLLVTVALVVAVVERRPDRRRIAAAIAVPLVIVGGWSVKNAVQFGTSGLSSFTGMNLLRSVEPAVGEAAMQRLVDDGTVSGVASAGTFRLYADYAPAMPPCEPRAGDPPVLASLTKPIPERYRRGLDPADTANFNARCYLAVFEQAGDDATAIIRSRPGDWVKARAWATNNWFQVPAADPGGSWLWDAERVASRVVLLGAPHPGVPGRWAELDLWVHRNPVSLTLIAASALVLTATTGSLRRARRSRSWHRSRDVALLMLVTWIVAWNALAGVVFELGEQERFRSTTDPIVLAVAAWLALRRWRPDAVATSPHEGASYGSTS